MYLGPLVYCVTKPQVSYQFLCDHLDVVYLTVENHTPPTLPMTYYVNSGPLVYYWTGSVLVEGCTPVPSRTCGRYLHNEARIRRVFDINKECILLLSL